MPDGKFLKCNCVHCGGHIEFPADGIGATIPCPHCARDTELVLEASTAESATRHSKKWIIAGVVILVVGVIGAIGALVTAKVLVGKAQRREGIAKQRETRKDKAATTSVAQPLRETTNINDFVVWPVTIDQRPGSSLTYAKGVVRNETDKQRFGVTVEIDLIDRMGAKIGSAKDYKDSIEPRSEWTFRALLVVKGVSSARVSTVREQ